MHHDLSFFADPRTYIGISFLIFYGVFGRKIWGALMGLLDKRSSGVRTELEEASRLRREAEAMLAAAQGQREQAARDAQTMLDNARTEAANVAETARKDASDAARRRERMAMDRISAAEKAAITEVRQAAADIASRAAEQVLVHGFGADQDATLVDRAIQQLPTVLASRRAA